MEIFTFFAIVIPVIIIAISHSTIKRLEKESRQAKIKFDEQKRTIDSLFEKNNQLEARLQKATEVENYEDAILGLQAEWETKKATILQLHQEQSELQNELEVFEKENLDVFSGLYKPKYDFENSELFKQKLDEIRKEQKKQIQNGLACLCDILWQVNGSVVEGRKITKQYIKLMLRAFNGECDAYISKVNYKNANAIQERLLKLKDSINKIAEEQRCFITSDYLNLKLQELFLVHEYNLKLQAEKEEQKIIQEQIREEQKALREIEKLKEEAEKEERQFQKALETARIEFEAANEFEKEKLQNYINQLEIKLHNAEEKKERAISQAQLTKLGHVYIISNIGSFGENVYKIGMTRRLEPMDRVKELGDASVPFPFDVHAIIFSENAPELELKLHRALQDRSINKINPRKEFFNADLIEIKRIVEENHGQIEFTLIAEAGEYRQSLELAKIKENTVQV